MRAMASQITNLTIDHSSVYSGADKRKHQSSASPTFVRGIHRWPANSRHKGQATRKMFPFDDVIKLQNVIMYHCRGRAGKMEQLITMRSTIKTGYLSPGSISDKTSYCKSIEAARLVVEIIESLSTVKFQSDRIILDINLAASRLCKILQ